MHLGENNKRFSYSMDGVRLEEVEVEQDVGVLVADNLRPSQQCGAAAARLMGPWARSAGL